MNMGIFAFSGGDKRGICHRCLSRFGPMFAGVVTVSPPRKYISELELPAEIGIAEFQRLGQPSGCRQNDSPQPGAQVLVPECAYPMRVFRLLSSSFCSSWIC